MAQIKSDGFGIFKDGQVACMLQVQGHMPVLVAHGGTLFVADSLHGQYASLTKA